MRFTYLSVYSIQFSVKSKSNICSTIYPEQQEAQWIKLGWIQVIQTQQQLDMAAIILRN